MNKNQHLFLEEVLPLMNLQPNDRILELGCGEGWACRRMAESVTEGLVIGLDASNDCIREARAQSTAFENILYVWSNAEQIPWQEDFFTGVLAVNAIPYFEDMKKVVSEVLRVMTSGGTIWIINQVQKEVAFSGETPPEGTPTERSANARSLPAQDFLPDEFLSLLKQSGFENIAVRTLSQSINCPGNRPDAMPNQSLATLISARKPASASSDTHEQTNPYQL